MEKAACTPAKTPRRYPNGTPLPEIVEKDDGSSSEHLTVASYNLLAEIYVRPYDKRTMGVQPFAAFDWISQEDTKEVLDMSKRGPRLIRSLRSCHADVICLQELQLERDLRQSHSDGENSARFILPKWIRPIVEEDAYVLCLPSQAKLSVMAARNGRVLGNDVPVTCAILYNSNRLEAISDKGLRNSNSKQHVDTTSCVSVFLRGLGKMDTVGPLTITSIHLDATDEKKRVGQLSRCLRRARSFATIAQPNLQPLNTIIAGDFNDEFKAGSCVAAFLANGIEVDGLFIQGDKETDHQNASQIIRERFGSSSIQLEDRKELHAEAFKTVRDFCVSLNRIETKETRSAYDEESAIGQQIIGQWRLDHILYTSATLCPVGYWATLEDDHDSCMLGLPNRRFGSDHMPIAAVFRILPQTALGDEERANLMTRLKRLTERQRDILEQTQKHLDEKLRAVEALLHSASNEKEKEKEKEKKREKPHKDVVDFMRKRRSIIKNLKARQKEERNLLVNGLDDLHRLSIEEQYGYSAMQWVERGP